MRIDRSLKYLTILAAVTACSTPADSAAAQPDAAPAAAVAAPAAAPAADPAPGVAVNVRWDSAPLDLEYRNARAELDARHAREIAAPRVTETVVVRDRRQAAESKALEVRYTKGKNDHARSLPPS